MRGITADFAPGRIYALLGENGAGKSTFLRVIAGLVKPTSGTVNFGAFSAKSSEQTNGSNLADAREAGHIGYMGHASMLYDELSGMENLRYFGRLYGQNAEKSCAEWMSAVGLDPSPSKYVRDYSQGMRQRLSLARALSHGPKLLLLDEPFSNVDAESAQQMIGILARLRDEGKTVLVVTHQAVVLDGVADERVVMKEGLVMSRES